MFVALKLFAVESWSLYAFGVGLVLARLISRLFTLGSLRRLQLDDWIMVIVIVPFTGVIVTANESYLPKSVADDQVRRLKLRFVLEELHLASNWLIKACLIILYRRIFPSPGSSRERIILVYNSAYWLLSFILIQVLLPLWCTPFRDYWDPSPQNSQCQTYRYHTILALALDTTTITTTLLLPIAFIPTPRKFLQAALLALGASVLASAILSRYYLLVRPAASPARYIHWYLAQLVLMLLFANLPFLTSLFTSTPRASRRSISLASWPRSWKDSAGDAEQRLRTGSATTVGSVLDERLAKRLWSTASVSSPSDVDCVLEGEVAGAEVVPPVQSHALITGRRKVVVVDEGRYDRAAFEIIF
ncbi:hypothetical protein BU23DRAFT_205880 [Bimuria novae-zelandiae CBS 107.79]|uniref:Rhodopsin domain-containing protein n=1 Tax=Bimuria novae-zelandiae CBS 107.79 TaxID=1447943 RepID=A0A6A5V0V1_9PLEO|nr:hypothetical protein BU23DRAFT_205880 [Bimuria novae-zelandiae CBS 107.79]